jgi:hypothetical protein
MSSLEASKVALVQGELVALRAQFFSEFAASAAHEMEFLAGYIASVQAELPLCVDGEGMNE